MIHFIKGILNSVKDDLVIVENNGIGFEIFLSSKDIEKISNKINNEVLIYTYLIHKEDNMNLFGFLTKETRVFFTELLKVDGIGPKLALKILGSVSPEELYRYIEEENIDMLKKIHGIGPKMVGKIILELKGKINTTFNTNFNPIEKEIISALVNLGYDEQIIIETIKKNKIESEDFEKEFKRILKLLGTKVK